ncbi:MAG: ATP-binding cassette domain-containing protein, partial [Microcystaceae cyanobacterium]
MNQVNFKLQRGQILGIVGESGSGKSVTSLAIMSLIPSPGKITEGEIWFRFAQKTRNGELITENYAEPVDLLQQSEEKRRNYRGNQIAMIFQEPMSSLNPVYNIGFQITEAILHHNRRISKQAAWEQGIQLLERVKLLRREDTELFKQSMMKRYPHELSGGQLQRVMIAIAISCNPTILIADEPTTALDVTVQAGILDLLRELCRQQNMSMIFITHDFGVIAEIADAVIVMREGKIVEQGSIRQILENPQEPYTKGLLACRPPLQQKLTYLPTVDEFLKGHFNRWLAHLLVFADSEDVFSLFWLLYLAHGNSITDMNCQEVLAWLIDFRENQSTPQDAIALTGKSLFKATVAEKSDSLYDSQDSSFKSEFLLKVKDLRVGFPKRGMFGQTQDYFMAVDGVSFKVKRGETLGLVG